MNKKSIIHDNTTHSTVLRKTLLILLCCIYFIQFGQAQTVYLTSSGGSFPAEIWMSITTGVDGSGTLVWSKDGVTPFPTGTFGTGHVTDEAIDLTAYCGQTLYFNTYDRYADSWNGSTYVLEESTSGPTIINNGGISPDDGTDSDCNGSSWCDTDPSTELESSESFTIACLCSDPVATFTLDSNCPTDFSIIVDVTNTGDGATVDITNDGTGVAATNGVGVGMYTIGPFSLGQSVITTVTGDGGCDIASSTLTEACNCAMTPIGTVTSANLDCGAGTFDIQVTVDSDESGDANMTDILIDGTVVQANATEGTLYTFNRPVGAYTITLAGEGATFASCTSIDYPISNSCTNLNCADAFNVPLDGTTVSTTALPGASSTYEGTSCDPSGNEETWFQFTAPASGLIQLTIANYSSQFENLDYAIFSGACGSLTEVYCAAGNTPTPVDAELISGLTSGDTYYLQTSVDDGGGETFDVSMTSPVSSITALTANCFDLSTAPHIYDLGDLGDDYDCGFSTSYSGSTDDQIGYIYTPAANETIDIILDNVVTTSSNDFAVAIFDNTTGTPVSCLDGTTTSTDVTLSGVSLTGGTSYIIIIGGYDSTHDAQGCLTIQPQCGAVFTNTVVNDCAGGTFTSTLNFSSLGSATTINITEGTTAYNSISLGMDYAFSYTDIATKMLTINGYDAGGSLVCSEMVNLASGCNGGDVCGDALDITNGCAIGDLTTANIDGGDLIQNFIGCGNGNSIVMCGISSSFTGSSYTRTDHTDIWYAVNPNGSDEITIEISNLVGGNVMVLPYLTNGTCPSAASANDLLENHIGNQSQSLTNGNCPYFVTDGSLTLQGTALTTATTVYLRIMAYAENGSGATNCETLTYATFDICTMVPQANDVCGDALPINDASTFLPQIQSGDISAANTDADTHDEVNGETCNGITFDTAEEDLWYSLDVPANGNYYLELDIDFTGPEDEIYVLLHNYCANGDTDPIGCESISADGTVVFDQNNITNFDNALTSGDDFNIRIVRPTGSTAAGFTISAQLIAENNNCEVLQGVFPGFDVENMNNDMNFNFATDSGVFPVIAGNDLWYHFDPEQSTDAATGLITASTTAEVVIGGLDPGQELTLVLYKGNTVSSNNCNDLEGDYLETLEVTDNGVVELACLDELHLSTDGGYLIRVIQTAGITSDNSLINAQPQPAGPYNNDCENIWNGSGPAILGANGEDATTSFNPFVILPGFSNYRSGDFENSTDCHPDITSAICNGVDQQAIASNEDRDMWYIVTIPDNTCAADGLTASSVVNGVTFLYNSGSQFEDAILYLYSGCDDTDLIDCSGPLDGAPSGAGDDQFNDPQSTWTVTGLTQGESYLVRVKPHDISSSGVNNEFDFDLSWKPAPVSPCNDDPDDAEPLPVACFDYSGLETWSAQGATETNPVDGAPETDVWFSFVAPDNGGTYTSAGSWATVFFEAVSGEAITVELYNTMSTAPAGETEVYTASGAGDQAWAVFGNLNPGQTYYIRLYHKEQPTVNVTYKIAINDGPGIEPGWGCGETSLSNINDCASGCIDLRETFFKIDLPDGTPGNAYWAIEVTGIDQDLNFELRSQYNMSNSTYTPSSATGVDGGEGGYADHDHPCSSRALEPAVSITSTTDDLNGCDGNDSLGDIDPASTSQGTDGNSDIGSGTKRVYFNMNGAVAPGKDYYFLRVFIESTDPRYDEWAEVKICDISFKGPYSTPALADAGGTPDLQCLSCDISDVAITSDAVCVGANAEFVLNFDVTNGSGDYEVFATADNATLGITTGDVLGTITSAGATGTNVAITGTITSPTTASTISVDIRDTNNPTGCLSGSPVTINVPSCFTCLADAGDISNNSSTPNALSICSGGDLLTGVTEVVFSSNYTALDETTPGAGFEYIFVLADANGTIQLNSTTGNFDFSTLTEGTYTVHGISYATSNTINTVAAYLTSITGDATVDDISQIETDETGNAICVDIDSGALTGQTTTVTISDNPTANAITGATTLCGNTLDEAYSVTNNAGHTYAWTISAGGTLDNTTGNSVTVDWANIGGGFTLSVVETETATGCNSTNTLSVMITAEPSATVTTTATVCSSATETGNDEGQEDLDMLVVSGDMTGVWTILSGNTGGTATISGSMAGGDVVFDAGTEDGPIVVRYTLSGTAPCTDQTYDVTITRFECEACAPEVGIIRTN